MNKPNQGKQAFVLIEIIFAIALFSIIAFGSMKLILSLHKKNHLKSFNTQNLIKLETTRMFLEKNKQLENLKYQDESLYYNDYLLLNEVSKYEKTISGLNIDVEMINICIYDDKICQEWAIRK